MNKKIYAIVMAGSLTALALTGCNKGKAEGETTAAEIMTENTLSASRQAILELEEKIKASEASEADYVELSALYEQEGMIQKQRDALEAGYCLFGSKELLVMLQDITVNVAENAGILAEAERMHQNLDLDEYLDEGIAAILSEDWFTLMMPKLKEGHRNYYYRTEAGENLFMQAGYDDAGQKYSKVWHVNNENQVRYVYQSGESVQMFQTVLKDGQYDGNFESWVCLAGTGSVYHESGMISDGILTGDYTAEVHFGKEGSDLFALWQSRKDMEMIAFSGNFGTDGRTTLTQPKAERHQVTHGGNGQDGYVVYAYDENGDNYLFVNTDESVEGSVIFGMDFMELSAYPQFTPYDVAEPFGDEELFLGQEDENAGEHPDENAEGVTAIYARRGAGSIEKPEINTKPSGNTTNNSAGSTTIHSTSGSSPGSGNSNSGSNSGSSPGSGNSNSGSNSGSSPGSGNNNTNNSAKPEKPESSGEDTGAGEDMNNNEDINSGDVDIEWTDDIL